MTKFDSGFTLIETIIYIGLFAFIIGGSILSVNQLLQASAQTNTKATVQDEENFVLRKIDWALGSIDPTKPFTPSSGYSDTLSLTRYDGTKVAIRLSGGVIRMSEDGGTTYFHITTSNVTVDALGFAYIPAVGTGPAGITASTTINGFVSSTTKYIRK